MYVTYSSLQCYRRPIQRDESWVLATGDCR